MNPPVPDRRLAQFMLLVISISAAVYARFTLSPLQETIRVALSLSDNQMALLQGPALTLPMVLAAVPIGLIIDRSVRVRLLFILSLVEIGGTALSAFASDLTVLFVARCLIGLSVPAICTAVFSLLGDLYPPAQRGRATMVAVIGQYGGLSLAFAFGGAVLGRVHGPNAWRESMLLLCLPLFAAAVLTLLLREPPRLETAIERPSARESFGELWRYRAVIATLIVGLVMGDIGVYAVLTWAAPAFTRQFGLAVERIGAIMGVAVMVSGVLGPLLGGVLADACQRSGGPRRTVWALSGLALASAPAGVFAVMPDVTSASVLLVLSASLGGAILVIGTALFTIVIPNELRGMCLSISVGAQSLLGIGLVPVAISLLSGAMGGPGMLPQALASVSVAAGLVGAVAFALGSRFFEAGRRNPI